jgi:hypothetical protein
MHYLVRLNIQIFIRSTNSVNFFGLNNSNAMNQLMNYIYICVCVCVYVCVCLYITIHPSKVLSITEIYILIFTVAFPGELRCYLNKI